MNQLVFIVDIYLLRAADIAGIQRGKSGVVIGRKLELPFNRKSLHLVVAAIVALIDHEKPPDIGQNVSLYHEKSQGVKTHLETMVTQLSQVS